jgi:hypothetical protein
VAVTDTYNGIYSEPTFVSVFAARSPEEDYVETYKYLTLANALGSFGLSISLPGNDPSSVDVLDNVRNPTGTTLSNKISCVPPVN